ncbi:helix-turn-helix domain-containing protein [Nostoc sp. PA-18-2419]|uniref:helix-turn-helix domain-containing protein n=1 Tax=Nostoc sp. PA-18-2419 TaxID=2575443 RepID=UPI0011091827|nr:helix-turn-helix transcriptional regulator [Nostoc sp. PA-18-2419]
MRLHTSAKLIEYFAAECSGLFFFDRLWQFEKNIPHPLRLAFSLKHLGALCLHISTWRGTLQLQSTLFNSLNTNPLTQCEIQIVQLVAQGLTNAEIGTTLWITKNSVKQALKPIFRKLDVSYRAEMVGRLSSNISLVNKLFHIYFAYLNSIKVLWFGHLARHNYAI